MSFVSLCLLSFVSLFLLDLISLIIAATIVNNITIAEHVELFVKEGNDIKTAIKLVAKERNVSKSEIYNAYHQIGSE